MAYEHEKDPKWQAEIARSIDDLLGGKPSEDSGRKQPGSGGTVEFGPADEPCPGCGEVHPPGMGAGFHLGFAARVDPEYAKEMGDQVKKIGDVTSSVLKLIADNIQFGPKAVELAMLRRSMQSARNLLRDHPPEESPLVRAHLDHLAETLRSMEKLERTIDVLPKEMWEGIDPRDIPGFGGGSGYADPTGE